MPYMTFLDYTTLDARGKSIEAKLNQKDQQIFSMQKQIGELRQVDFQKEKLSLLD